MQIHFLTSSMLATYSKALISFQHLRFLCDNDSANRNTFALNYITVRQYYMSHRLWCKDEAERSVANAEMRD